MNAPVRKERGELKNRILNKLRSQTGASISFALLLFLVCAVLCSVIITAATAASGRMSRIAETDQRYYAVTSAAELMKDLFGEHPTVTVVKVVKTDYTTTYEDGNEPVVKDGQSTIEFYYVVDKKASEIENDDLDPKNQIGNLAFNYTIQIDAAKQIFEKATSEETISDDSDRKLSLTVSGSESDINALAVEIQEDLAVNGDFTLMLYNKYQSDGTTESDAGSRYTMILSYGADMSLTTSTKTENGSSITNGDNSYKIISTTTETTIMTLTWTLTGITTP